MAELNTEINRQKALDKMIQEKNEFYKKLVDLQEESGIFLEMIPARFNIIRKDELEEREKQIKADNSKKSNLTKKKK